MLWLYNGFLVISLVLFSPVWLLALACIPKLRAGFWQKCGFYPAEIKQQLLQQSDKKRVWLHAVSVGELNAAKPLIRALLESGKEVVVSTTTATGYALAKKQLQPLPIFFFPFDLPWIIQNALQLIHPQQIVIMETEIWPNLLTLASKQDIPVLLVNGRLSQKSFEGYLKFKPFFQPILNLYTALLMQSNSDAQRVQALGAHEEKVMVCGNIKFDAVATHSIEELNELKILFNFPSDANVLVFASTHAGEDEIFLSLFLKLQTQFPNLYGILAPRHPERFGAVGGLFSKMSNSRFSKRSQLTAQHPNTAPIILLDSIGELARVMQLATLTVMGGSFIPWGGHNPLESLRVERPVIFGPSMQNFADIAQKIVAAKAGVQISSIEEAETAISQLLNSPETYDQMVKQGQHLLLENRGALKKMMSVISQF